MICWLSSYPKSGNTWVRMFMNAYLNGGHLDINRMLWGAADNRRYVYESLAPRGELTREELILLRPAALLHLDRMMCQNPLIVKTHHFNGVAHGIPLIPEQLTQMAIYIVRDPRAVAVSYARYMKVDIDTAIKHMGDEQWSITEDGTPFFHSLSSWSEHVKSWLNEDKFPVHLVKYEKMLEDPDTVFRNILLKFGIYPINEESFQKSLEATKLKNLQETEESRGFKEAPDGVRFFSGLDWRDFLSKEQQSKIEEDHGELMGMLGYL